MLCSRLGKPVPTDFRKFWEFGGSVLGAFYVRKSHFLEFQEGVEENAHLEAVLVAILGRFWNAWECQK